MNRQNGHTYYDWFLSVDPMASIYPGFSPYAYLMNNPLRFIDPTGMCTELMNNVEEGTYDGEEAQALFAQYCETDDTIDNNSDSFTMQDIDEINSMLLAGSFSASIIENFWKRFVSLNADDLIRLRENLEKSLPKNRVDAIMDKHHQYIQFAMATGTVLFVVEGVVVFHSISQDLSVANIAERGSDFGVSIGMFTRYIPLKAGIIYHVFKWYSFEVIKALQDGHLNHHDFHPHPAGIYVPRN